MRISKLSTLIVILGLAISSQAATTIQVSGKVSQIKDGKVEFVAKRGTTRIPLKNLPKNMRKAVTDAQAKKKVLHLSLMPQMLAGK